MGDVFDFVDDEDVSYRTPGNFIRIFIKYRTSISGHVDFHCLQN